MAKPSQQTIAWKTTTIRDIAARVGVHSSTVSRALNPETRKQIRREVADRILAAADDLGYVPNSMAYALKKGQSQTVGIIIPDLLNPVFPPIIRGIQDTLDEAGYTAIVANSEGNKEYERGVVGKMRARFVDGLIMATAVRKDAVVGECVDRGIPIVLINRDTEDVNVSAVINDDRAGIAAAVNHLADLGHERIAHVAGPQVTSTGFARYQAFVESMAARRLPADEDLVTFAEMYSIAAGAAAVSALLDRAKPFSAVIGANDQLVLGGLDRLAQAGRRCPGDVSVVGFNDMPLVDRIDPPLTTLRIQHYEMGAEAARILLEELRQPGTPARTVMLKPRLVVRGSTADAAR